MTIGRLILYAGAVVTALVLARSTPLMAAVGVYVVVRWAWRTIRRHPRCEGCQRRNAGVAGAGGFLTAFATGSYAGARAARTLHAIQTGRLGTRLANIALGRGLVSRMWFR